MESFFAYTVSMELPKDAKAIERLMAWPHDFVLKHRVGTSKSGEKFDFFDLLVKTDDPSRCVERNGHPLGDVINDALDAAAEGI